MDSEVLGYIETRISLMTIYFINIFYIETRISLMTLGLGSNSFGYKKIFMLQEILGIAVKLNLIK